MSILAKLITPRGKWDATESVFEPEDSHTFIQAVGYLKYALRASGPILARGQGQVYATLCASLFRGVGNVSHARKREAAFNELKNAAAAAFIPNTPPEAKGPILQHYGIRSPWIDLVDNAWVALWFACHHARVIGKEQHYLHYERRSFSGSEFAYVLLLQAGGATQSSPGFWSSPKLEMVDLRVAAPSLYLRPHAQHGVLMRAVWRASSAASSIADVDLMPAVVGVLRIRLDRALAWLGEGRLLDVHSLFPPPHYDLGYMRLLGVGIRSGSRMLGSIYHICP